MRSAIVAACSGRKGERLVEAVRVQRLRAAAGCRERLDRDPDDVVLGLLGRQRPAAGLRVEAQRLGLRLRRSEALAHDWAQRGAGGAEFRDLDEEVVVRVEEEREPRAERVRREPRRDRCLAVGDAVGEREGELLRRRRARLAHVIARDRDRVPERDPLARSRRTDRSSASSTAAAGRCSCRGPRTP